MQPSPHSGNLNPVQMTLGAALLANALVLVFPLAAAILEGSSEDLYYKLVQEDGVLEWMTVWAFALAAVGFGLIARSQYKAGQGLPWLTVGVSAFCVVFALEEISWGQRLLGYRPPEYFLKENFQQEFNLHNVFSTSARKLVLKAIILGYGVVLPLVALIAPLRRLLERLGPQVPPLALIPAFLACFIIYEIYPWSFSGEIIELMLGLGFLFAAFAPAVTAKGSDLGRSVAGFAATGVLGLAAFAWSHFAVANDPTRIETAQTELSALAADMTRNGRAVPKCGVHKRVYSWAVKYEGLELLAEGGFAGLQAQGLPEARAGYFIDPWNSPYWVRHKCRRKQGREMAYVYSFGPNRRRESTEWEIGGDDIGVVIFQRSAD